MTKLDEFITRLEQEVTNHSIYVLGAQGQTGSQITEAWIRMREHNKPENYNRAIAFWKKQIAAGYGGRLRAFDCSGLGIWILQQMGLRKGDTTANGMYGECRLKLKANTWKRGDWVFRGSASKKTHIGYIVDDKGTVIECQGRDAGVCKTKTTTLDSKGKPYWQYFARPDIFRAEIEGGEPVSRKLEVTTPYRKGGDIKQLQLALTALGYDPGTADGIFGKNTKKALDAFIADQK